MNVNTSNNNISLKKILEKIEDIDRRLDIVERKVSTKNTNFHDKDIKMKICHTYNSNAMDVDCVCPELK